MVSKTLTDHGVVRAVIKENVVQVGTEKEEIEVTDVFMFCLGGGYGELIASIF